LTKRCTDLFKLLRAARWLTTSQIRRRFFPHATADATRKWLRKATQAGYLRMYRQNRMTECLFTLGSEGKRALERCGVEDIMVLERRPSKQIEHRSGINDIRIAANTSLPLSYFFACWELSALDWQYPIIPDAVFAVGRRTFAVEFDRGLESIRYFLRTKVAVYRRGLEGFPLSTVLIVADSKTRMLALAKAIAVERGRFLFTTLDLVRKHGLAAPIFRHSAYGEGEKLV
jgi:hypothetical protein